jgi:acetyltransferase-like isoleucine patch superfamily enzyme/dTDP-4-dehydrorhamnose 3,5-epimerase-like enzyme
MTTDHFIHPLADVQTEVVGSGTRIWQFVVALPGARIGADGNICSHCFIENDVIIGDRVTIKNGVQLWDGLRIADDVFIGPNVTFTNDKFPRSRQHQHEPLITEVASGASLGAGATVLPGLKIGRNAMIGSGAVVTRSVPANAIVVGNPARIVGYVGADSENADVAAGDHSKTPSESAVAGVKLCQLPNIPDLRGSLTVGEFARSIPFAAKRYFIVFDVPSPETRGEHAHHQCHQFLICARGSVSAVVDDGRNREEYVLDRPDLGLYIPPKTWSIQYKYSADAVLLVFASHYYDADDYIRDYDEFIDLMK